MHYRGKCLAALSLSGCRDILLQGLVYWIIIRLLRLTKPCADYQYNCEEQHMMKPSFSQRQILQEYIQYVGEDHCMFVVQRMKWWWQLFLCLDSTC